MFERATPPSPLPTDHHIIALRAFEKALALGYRRPGLVLDEVIDCLVEGRFTAGFRTGQQTLPARRRLPPFLAVQKANQNRCVFERWFARSRPDLLFTLYNEVRDWVRPFVTARQHVAFLSQIALTRSAQTDYWFTRIKH